MKRKTIFCALLISALAFTGCSSTAESNNLDFETVDETGAEQESGTEHESGADTDAQADEQTDESAGAEQSEAADATDTNETVKGSDVDPTQDFSADYTEDIKKDVEAAVAGTKSIQEEIDAVSKVAEKYQQYASKATGQADMNQASQWPLEVCDLELNSLWDRISNSADAKTKEDLLAKQRMWNSNKENMIVAEIGPREESGTIYPLLYNNCMDGLTYNRCMILANELAKIKGESFKMPERGIYNTYVDDQGTSEIYSQLVLTQGMEGDNVAKLDLYRAAALEGSFTEKGNGVLEFTDDAGDVNGTIKLDGWNGATFEVTKCDSGVVSVGEKFEFNFAF